MNVLLKSVAMIALAILVAGAVHAAPSSSSAASLPPVNLMVADSLAPPPPPPPPTCPTECTRRYQRCIAGGINPAVCAGKYNYCMMNC